ncbi:MAG: glycosyltransferase family 39 protein, partial [Anaerolineae bacterium]|nr:glycosyltransferase family 39 protein [Anaerolineae bacterium]
MPDHPVSAPLAEILIVLLSVGVRVAWLAWFPAAPAGTIDAEGYHLLARNLVAGHGLSMAWEAPFCPDSLRTPLYPLFLAVIYRLGAPNPAAAIPFQVLLEALTTAWALRLGRALGGPRTGVLAGLLYALNGASQRYTGILFTETLLLPILAAALWATVLALQRSRPRTALYAGALWGLAILTKPNLQYLALAVGGLVLFAGLRLRTCRHLGIMFLVALGVTVMPWMARNRWVFNRWMISTAFEENVARVSAVAALAEVEGIAAEPWTPTWEALYDRIVAGAMHQPGNTGAPQDPCRQHDTAHRNIAATARDIVVRHPWPTARAHLRGLLHSLLDVGHNTWYPALTGNDWRHTGVVDDIWGRMAWSLKIGAVGDALQAFWRER